MEPFLKLKFSTQLLSRKNMVSLRQACDVLSSTLTNLKLVSISRLKTSNMSLAASLIPAHWKINIFTTDNQICDWLWENLPVTHKDNYLEKHN